MLLFKQTIEYTKTIGHTNRLHIHINSWLQMVEEKQCDLHLCWLDIFDCLVNRKGIRDKLLSNMIDTKMETIQFLFC